MTTSQPSLSFSSSPENPDTPGSASYFSGLQPSRRTILRTGAAAAGAVGAAGFLTAVASPTQARAQTPGGILDGSHTVFQHGVASGDPLAGSVLLWTRVTSHPDDVPGSGSGEPVSLLWQVSSDDSFSDTLASGQVTSDPENDNCVKIDATGLPSDTWFSYRFAVAEGPYAGQSITGRSRTVPSPGVVADHLGIGLTSCANWESGYFSAYRDMANNPDLDLIMCVGDYIYEYGTGEYGGKDRVVRVTEPAHEIVTLQDYRIRYGQYRTDPDLQAAHAAKPWVVTWDDHEVANDNWRDGAENHQPDTEGDFHERHRVAMRAYLEWLPVRATPISDGGHLYRTLNYGSLAEIVMLDLRSYRDEGLEFRTSAGTDDESRTMLGSEQFQYLSDQWTTSDALWNLVGNSVMFTPVLIPPLDPEAHRAITGLLGIPENGMPYNLDQWDGYAAERRRVIDILTANHIDNVVFLTGDIHSSWATNVPVNAASFPDSGIAASEIVCTSVSSSNIDDILGLPSRNAVTISAETALQAANRHCKYIEFDSHGYVAVHVSPEEIRAEYRLLTGDVQLPNQDVHAAQNYRICRGEAISPA